MSPPPRDAETSRARVCGVSGASPRLHHPAPPQRLAWSMQFRQLFPELSGLFRSSAARCSTAHQCTERYGHETQRCPGTTQRCPGTTQRCPGLPRRYPGPTQRCPGAAQALPRRYPGPTQRCPGATQAPSAAQAPPFASATAAFSRFWTESLGLNGESGSQCQAFGRNL